MIKLNRPIIPGFLVKNRKDLTDKLMDAITKYKGYENIPEKEKDILIKSYRHEEIKSTLFKSSNEKCAFCESIPGDSGYLEVEHYHPKSLYPNETFKWNNLLPSCKKCNIPKSNLDTKKYPIVNPYDYNPDDYFKYSGLKIVVKEDAIDKEIANNTIEACNLNSPRLFKPRAALLIALSQYENDLEKCINDVHEADTERKRKNKIVKLIDSIEIIEDNVTSEHNYSAFSKDFLNNSEIYQTAKKICTDFLNNEK